MNAQTLPPALRRFWLWMAAGTALSILYTAASAYLFRLPAPYGLPLLWGKGFGSDFMTFYPGFSHFGTDTFWFSFDYPFTYPAPAAIAFAALFKLSHPVRTYLLLCIVALAVGMAAMARQLIRSHISAGTAWAFTITNAIMAWPILLLFDTANIEGLVAILLTGGVLAILWNRFWLGAILVGIAGSMKLFPLILLGLLLSKRRYKEFAAALFVAAAVSVASLHLLGPTIVEAQRHINVGLVMVKNIYFFAEGRNTTAFDHSLWVPVRFAAAWIARSHSFQDRTLTAYLCTIATAGPALFFGKIRHLPVLNQVLALTLCAVLLPPLSIDYTLIHLLVPFGLLCVYATSNAPASGLSAIFTAFAVLFNIDSFLTNRFTYAAEARTLALLVLLILVLRNPFPWAKLDSAAPSDTASNV